MGFLAAWFEVEARRRRRELCALGLLVAVGLAVVLTSMAGALRGASAPERLRAVTLPADARVSNVDPQLDWDRVRALPGVEAVAPYAIAALYIEGMPLNWLCIPPVDATLWRDLERPVLLAGRLPDPARPDEVVVQWRFTQLYGKSVGDSVHIRLNTPQEVDLDAEAGGTMPGGHGPRVTATIVGVIRSPVFSDGVDGPGVVLPSSGLFQKYRDNLMGVEQRGFSVALVRLTHGPAGVDALREQMKALTGHPVQVDDLAQATRHYDQVTSYEALSLAAFGLAALTAAALVIGQYVARTISATLADLRPLRAGGLTRGQEATAAALGPVAACLAGSVLGVLGAAAASVWTPIGAAANFEPHPGFDLDPRVLLPPIALVPLLVAAEAAVVAWATRAVAAAPRSPAVSGIASMAARLNLPIQVVTGLRYALGRSTGPDALPVRSAISGTLAGVLGVTAALTFSAGVADAAGTPSRFGQSHQALLPLGYNGDSDTSVVARVTRDPDVTGVVDARMATVSADGNAFIAYGMAPYAGKVPVEVVTGQAPVTDADLLLAVSTAQRLKAGVGDLIRLTGPEHVADFRISAIGLLPIGVSNTYDDGALLTSAGLDRLSRSPELEWGLIVIRPDADQGAVLRRLQQTAGQRVGISPAPMPPQLSEVRDVRVLPVALAAFLALLAVVAVGHAVSATGQRRRPDIAVLRALGMTPAQTRWIALTQAGALTALGLAFGLPLGVLFGRTLWRLVAENTPLIYTPPTPVWALALAVPIGLATATALAAWPAHAAARLHLANVLCAE